MDLTDEPRLERLLVRPALRADVHAEDAEGGDGQGHGGGVAAVERRFDRAEVEAAPHEHPGAARPRQAPSGHGPLIRDDLVRRGEGLLDARYVGPEAGQEVDCHAASCVLPDRPMFQVTIRIVAYRWLCDGLVEMLVGRHFVLARHRGFGGHRGENAATSASWRVMPLTTPSSSRPSGTRIASHVPPAPHPSWTSMHSSLP